MKKIIKRGKAQVDKTYCVACGACVKNCPINAISIYRGIYAEVDLEKCVGCRKCEKVCPASVIEMIGVEV